jgi:hypothetical protein
MRRRELQLTKQARRLISAKMMHDFPHPSAPFSQYANGQPHLLRNMSVHLRTIESLSSTAILPVLSVFDLSHHGTLAGSGTCTGEGLPRAKCLF